MACRASFSRKRRVPRPPADRAARSAASTSERRFAPPWNWASSSRAAATPWRRLAPQVEAAADRGLAIDAALTAGGANLDLIELLDQAGPYGAGNPAPVFALPAHRIVYADRAGNDHIRCTLAADDGSRIKAVAFRALGTELGEFLMSERKLPAHIAGRLTVDDWNGARAASLHIVDAAAVS